MDRLAAELFRLYQLPLAGEALPADARLLWVSLRGPDAWTSLRELWQGVQADLEWPAPAIAVSGSDAFELWFSLAEPVDGRLGSEVLAQLVGRYLSPSTQHRLSLWPGTATLPERPGQLRPFEGEARWSAFVAADLAPVFAETPWLDLPPSADGQAELLAALKPISAKQWRQALERLRSAGDPVPAAPLDRATPAPLWSERGAPDPRQFLQQVMQDPQVALTLRIEAAKALLGAPQTVER